MAVERLNRCESIVALSEELGVHRRLSYKWRDQLDPVDIGDEPPPENLRESNEYKRRTTAARMIRASPIIRSVAECSRRGCDAPAW